MKIGITGHQDLSQYNIEWIENEIIECLLQYSVELGYSCLAIGIDQLFIKQLSNLTIPYVAVIPCDNYELTFKDTQKISAFKKLLKGAYSVHKLDYSKPSEQAFYDAGKKVVDLSDIIIAVWNGKPAKGLGGTADVVQYAKDRLKKVIHLNPVVKEKSILL